MSIGPGGAIAIAISCALCIVVIGAAVHRVYTVKNKSYDENGVPTSREWVPNQYAAEQLQRLDEVRWLGRRELWYAATEFRLSQGLGVADWYPGDEWVYRPRRRDSQVTNNAEGRMKVARAQNLEVLEQDIINNPGNIGHAYRAVPYLMNDTHGYDDDEYGVSAYDDVNVQPTLPDVLKRWTQHGAPRQSQQALISEAPRITLNDQELPNWDYQPYVEMHPNVILNGFTRSSSVYSTTPSSFIPRSPPAAYVASQRNVRNASDDHSSTPEPERSRVHQMIVQWERANGTFS